MEAFLSTLPFRPEAPKRPTCDPLRTRSDKLYLELQPPPFDNGLSVYEYQFEVRLNDRPVYAATWDAYEELKGFISNASVFNYTLAEYGRGEPMLPLAPYIVRSRAANKLGWSPWSEGSISCATPAVEVPPYDFVGKVVVPLSIVFAFILFCFYTCYKSNAVKVIAPRLRKKRLHGDPLSQFVSSDMTPMEEQDPELMMNPVLVARMQRAKERKRKKKLQAAGKSGATVVKSGGLARLGITCMGKEKESDPKKIVMGAVDSYLEEKGVSAAAKAMTEEEKEEQKKMAKKMSKAAKKAEKQSKEMQEQEERIAKDRGLLRGAKKTTMLSDSTEFL